MEISEKVKSLTGVSEISSTLDMIFSRDLSVAEQTKLENLVLDKFNEMINSPAAIAAGWTPHEMTRDNSDLGSGWSSDDRFETIDFHFASLLYDAGGVESVMHFLVDVDFIAPLEEVWIFVEASLDWLFEWVFDYDGEFGHYMEPAYINFKENPNEDERTRIELLFGFDSSNDDEFRDEGIWYSDNQFTIKTLVDIDPEYLLSQLNEVNDIIEIASVGIGVIVPL